MKPTPAITKKNPSKSKKPTKSKPKKGPLEDEIPEVNPVTTQMSQTTAATSSQQMVKRSQPGFETPPSSSQKEKVVDTGTPNYEALTPLGSIFHSPSPRAMSLSTQPPSPMTYLPHTILPLLNAIELVQTLTSTSQQHIIENILQQEAESDSMFFSTTHH